MEEKKVSETFEILFNELTSLLVMSGKGFFQKFKHTIRTKGKNEDLVGILVSAHVSALNFWIGKFIDSAEESKNEEFKNELIKIMGSVTESLSKLDGATLIKDGTITLK